MIIHLELRDIEQSIIIIIIRKFYYCVLSVRSPLVEGFEEDRDREAGGDGVIPGSGGRAGIPTCPREAGDLPGLGGRTSMKVGAGEARESAYSSAELGRNC